MPVDKQRKLADTALARWLNQAMSRWEDPNTGVLGLSGRRLAEVSGVSQGAIWQILKEGSTPKAEVLIPLAGAFHVSPLFLFRIAYVPESEASDFDPEVRDRLLELEAILAELPLETQLTFLESLAIQAKAIKKIVNQRGQTGSGEQEEE
jgi:transcriptional regulator with XRE-family HTH domain